MRPRDQQEKFFTMAREGAGYLAIRDAAGNFQQRWFADEASALRLIDQYARDHDVWVSMATFPDNRLGRNAASAEALCSLWLDVDAHEGSAYASPEDAKDAVDQFIKKAGLPPPNLIHYSGYGVQVLWTLDSKLSRGEWHPIASKLQDLCKRCFLEADPITADAARILRVPGTLNFRKPSHPAPTRLEVVSENFSALGLIEQALNKALEVFPAGPYTAAPKLHKVDFECAPTPENVQLVRNMLACIDPDPNPAGGGNRSTWMRVVWAVKATGWGVQSYELAQAWSEAGDLFDEGDFQEVWDSFDPEWTDGHSRSGISFGTLVHIARQAGYTGPLPQPDQPVPANPIPDTAYVSQLITTRAADIEPQPVEWLVDQSIPLGAMVVIGGQPGMGKSQIALSLAAAVTTGSGLPDGSNFERLGSVVILANEDDAARTIRPRLDAAGADLKRVHIVQGVAREGRPTDLFQLDTDIRELRIKAHALGDVRLIIIDPPSAYIGSKADSYKDSDVRQILTPLGSLAQETGALILLVVHLNKRSDGGAQQRFGGSTAWVAAPRAAFLVAEDPTTRDRFMLPVKNNLGDDRTGFQYQIHEKLMAYGSLTIKAPFVKWLGKSEKPAAILLDPPRRSKSSAVDEAKAFLESELGNAPVNVNDLKTSAEQAGISWSAIERAKREMLIDSKRTGNGWAWQMAFVGGDHGLE